MKYCLSLLLLLVWSLSLNAQTPAVGSIEGVFNVSDLGGASYSIPLKVPDGIGGIQPSISLNYSSQGGNGIMGMGWNLASGASAIMRIPNTIYNDKKATGVSLTGEDRFALDGNRLILMGGTYGLAGSSYHTEVESFKDINALGALGSGPMSFTVTDLSGTKYEYGTKTLSRPTVQGKVEPYMWLLDKVTDLNGNFMEYTYQYNSGEEPRLTHIHYTGNTNTGAERKSVILFSYDSRPDPNFGYVAGGKIEQKYRLATIYMVQHDAIMAPFAVHSYHLAYEANQYTHLVKVFERGHELNGVAEELPTTEFKYHPATAQAEMLTDYSVGAWKESEAITGDFNGDGFSDIIRAASKVQTSAITNMAFHLYLNNGNGGFNWAQNGEFISEPFDIYHDQVGRKDLFSWMGFGEAYSKASSSNNLPFDVNGDGFEDIVYRQSFVGEYPTSTTGFSDEAKTREVYSLYYSNGNTIGTSRVIKPMPNISFHETMPYVGDFDGDGLSEVLLLNTMQGVGATNNYIFGEKYLTNANMNNAGGQPIYLAKSLSNMPFDAAYVKDKRSKILVIDYNGDGKSDILSIWRDDATGAEHAQVFEMNVTFDVNNNPVIGNPVFKLVSDDGYPTLSHEIFPGDFNGDKITDVLTWIGSVGWEIGYGKGNGKMIDVRPMQAMNNQLSIWPYSLIIGELRPIIVSDYNGDGKSDIFDMPLHHPEANRILYSLGNDVFQQENISNLDQSRLLSSLKDYKLADFNGDGQAELYVDQPKNKEGFNGEDVNDHWYAYIFRFHPWENRHMVSQIINGLGSATLVGYQTLPTLSKLGSYSPSVAGYSYPFIKKTIPIKVVSILRHDLGGSTNPLVPPSDDKVTLFNYEGFKYHAQGKSVMGFDKMITRDNNKGITEEKTFALNTTYGFQWLKSTIIKQGQQVLNESNSTQNVYHYGNNRIFPYATQVTTMDNIKNTSATETYSYSLPSSNILGPASSMHTGKPQSITTNKGNGLEATTQTFTYPPIFGFSGGLSNIPSWVYSKPKSIITTNTRQGQPAYTRSQNFTYNASNGLLTSTISDPGTTYAQTTTNTYNTYGNLTQKTVSAAGISPRTEVFQYDATNRFLIKSYNSDYPALQTNTEYNILTGIVSQIKQADGFIKSFTYDGFNRVKTTADNNGGSASTSNIWAAGNAYAPANAKYGIQTSTNTSSASFTFYDRLGRVLRSVSPSLNGQMMFVDQQYDNKGQLISKTDPYFQGGVAQNNTFTYDNLGRITYQSTPSGNNTSFAYTTNSNGAQVTITNAAGQSKKTYTDKSGEVIKTEDEGGLLEYTYLSNSKVKTTTLNGTTVQQYEYDAYGRNTKRTDPNYGSYEYTYDNYDQLLSEKDPKGQVYNYTYDGRGKVTTKSGPEGTYAYIYNTTGGEDCGKLVQLSGPGGVTHEYSYGIGDKIHYEGRFIGNETFKTQYTYDNFGRVNRKIYPNNVAIEYAYNANTGSLQSVGRQGATYSAPSPFGSIQQPAYLYSIVEENVFGQTTRAGYQSQFPNGPGGMQPFTFVSNTAYNSYGMLTGQNTYKQSTNGGPAPVINNYSYNFQPTTGNLLQRKDMKYSLREDFTYDNVNRLTAIQGQNYGQNLTMFSTKTMDYAQNGNVIQKTDAGTFSYDQANRVSEINPYVNIPSVTQNITYTPFDKVATIEEEQNKAQFIYWADQDRAKMELLENNILKKTKYYLPGFEKEIDGATGQVRELCYIYGPDNNLVSIIERKSGVEKTYYVQSDYLGSITQIFDGNGNIVEEKSFDAWGRGRNPQSWAALSPTGVSNGWDRGYTGQEHLPQFGIINLNGRLYDPLMGRMMEPDPLIIGSGNSQGYNRYSYALNNPLKFTDPDGHHPVLVAVAIGAAVSAAMYSINVAASDGGFNNWSWRGFAGNVIIGAASGAATYGIGSGFGALASSATGTTSYVVEAGRALAHGVSSATFAMAGNGGDWDWSSFAAGVASSGVGSLASQVPILNTHVGGLGVSMAVGGMSSSITGGNFLQGAVTAGLVHGLNQKMHEDGGKGKGNKFRGGKLKDRDGDMKQYPKNFKDWYHKNKRDYVLPDQPDPDLKPIYEEWKQLGEPSKFKSYEFHYSEMQKLHQMGNDPSNSIMGKVVGSVVGGAAILFDFVIKNTSGLSPVYVMPVTPVSTWWAW